MSHQVRQIGKVSLTSLPLLKRAVAMLTTQQLGLAFQLHLDENKKEAVYYDGNIDKCDMVITANRELTTGERRSFYDIAIKLQDAVDSKGRPIKEYGLFGDANGSDRGIDKRMKLIMQRYLGEKRKAEHVSAGAEVTERINAKGEIVVSAKYTKH